VFTVLTSFNPSVGLELVAGSVFLILIRIPRLRIRFTDKSKNTGLLKGLSYEIDFENVDEN
jgi:hypothetical protein